MGRTRVRIMHGREHGDGPQGDETDVIDDILSVSDPDDAVEERPRKSSRRKRRADGKASGAGRMRDADGAAAADADRRDDFYDVIDISDFVALRRRLRNRMFGFRAVAIILFLLAASIIGYPLALQYQSNLRLESQTDAVADQVEGWPYPQAEDALKAAHAYNRKLAKSGQPVLGEAVDPFASVGGSSRASDADSASEKDEEYQSLLNVGNGVMGAIKIPKVSIDLPIYHGTSEEVLASGAGHLYGSSLPVGGKSTHSVITGHRGLVSALMFTRLDEMRVGDDMYIEIMGERYAYEVDRITVIEPDDTSQLKIVPGEDRLTLMTCTPYGVNTHRLLISGHRVSIPVPAPDPSDVYDARTISAMVTGAVLVPGLILMAFVKRGGWRVMRHGRAWPRHW